MDIETTATTASVSVHTKVEEQLDVDVDDDALDVDDTLTTSSSSSSSSSMTMQQDGSLVETEEHDVAPSLLMHPRFLVQLESHYPLNTDKPMCLGIDEAGRGPVLGPMVYGTAFWPIEQGKELAKLGFDDSKKLKESERDNLFDIIKGHKDIGWQVIVISPEEMSAKMLRKAKYNLNAISHDAAIELIRRTLERGVNLTEVYVDTVGKPEAYQARLSQIFPQLQITVASKADSLYPVVSAASICAKVTRDEVLRDWVFGEEGLETHREFGSGYPGQAKTKKWLSDHMDPVFGFPSVARFSWKTCSNMLKEGGVGMEWYDDATIEEDMDKSYDMGQKHIPKGERMKQRKLFEQPGKSVSRSAYFRDRSMDIVTDL